MKEYKDSAENENAIFKSDSAIIQVGDIITFGSYEQDNNKSNGKEDIEWIVLAKDGEKALIISKYALDCQPYNNSIKDITWEKCTLRKWLNGTFYNTAFSSAEQTRITTTTVTADKNPKYESTTNPGKNTQDKVFLLSITEVGNYFPSDSARKTTLTKYAIEQGAMKDDNDRCWWWLRSPGVGWWIVTPAIGSYSNYAAVVFNDGSIYYLGRGVYFNKYAVRPALWIKPE